MKKVLALVIALIMLLALSTTAFAAADASITINRNTTFSNVDTANSGNTTYTIYKVFDASYASNTASNTNVEAPDAISDTGTAFSYTIAASSPWVAVLGSFSGDTWTSASGQSWVTLSKLADSTKYQVNATSTMTDQAAAVAFADFLLANKGSIANNGTQTVAATVNSVTFSNLDRGYYLVDSTVGSNLVLATTNVSIYEKNQYPGVTKTVDSADESAQIGDVIDYTIAITVPTGADKDIIVTDTMSAGLTFESIVSVQNNDSTPANVTYTTHTASTDTAATLSAATVTANNNVFKIKIAAAQAAANAGKTITITYQAKLNKLAAVQGSDANTNNAELDYGNYHSTDSVVGIDTQKIEVLKYASTDNATPHANLADAVFELRLADGTTVVNLKKVSATEYRVADATETGTAVSHAAGNAQLNTVANDALVSDFVTVSSGNIVIKGLDANVTYKLVEIQAPAGYNLASSATDVTPSTSTTVTSQISNATGTVLPSTGGIGTTIFYTVGGLLVVCALVFFVTKRRMSAE